MNEVIAQAERRVPNFVKHDRNIARYADCKDVQLSKKSETKGLIKSFICSEFECSETFVLPDLESG